MGNVNILIEVQGGFWTALGFGLFLVIFIRDKDYLATGVVRVKTCFLFDLSYLSYVNFLFIAYIPYHTIP